MVRPSSEKRHAPSDASSPLYSALLPNALKTALLAFSCLCLLGSSPSMANDENSVVINDPANGATLGNQDTQLKVDIKENTVHIVIDGKEILTVDKDGLHVNGNIDYTGTIADITEANDAP